MRTELVSRDKFIKIVCENAVLGTPGKRASATGFADVVKAVKRLKKMPADKVEAYVKAKHSSLVRAGVALPLFKDIPRAQRGRRSDAHDQNVSIEAALLKAGASTAQVSAAMEHSLRHGMELKANTAAKAKTKRSQRKRADGQADLEDILEKD